MPTVADFIEQNRERLVERYATEAGKLESARGISRYELIDTFPEYLLTLANISRQGQRAEPEKTKQRMEETHISLRLRLGYTQEEVTHEYLLMGRLISSLWEDLPPEERPASEDTQLLFDELQSAMNQTVATFSGYTLEDRQHEKRALRRLDALSSEVIRDVEHPVALHERLEALVEVVQEAMHADGAALLLAEPDGSKLIPTVSTGRWSTVEEREPIPLNGSSFVAKLAASEETLALSDASASGAVSPGVSHSGLRSLLGLRLWPHGRLLGVLCVGVTVTRPFEPQSRRYFETLVEYLSGIIEKALLLQQLRQANHRLRHSEMRYRLATRAISDAIWDWDLLTDKLSWSEGVEKLFGHTREQLGGDISGWSDNIHPEDRERVVHGIHAVIQGGGERWRDEYRFRHGDGSYVHVIDQGLVERDPQGKGVRMVGAMQDITAHKVASEALQASEERLRLTLEATALGTWDFDPVTGTFRWDERCKALFGLPPDARIDYDTFLSVIHPEDRARADAVVQRSLSGETSGGYDLELRAVGPKDGVVRWVRTSGRTFFESGHAVRMVGIAQDISARKLSEVETRQRAEFTEQLIGIVSHDLRSPLNAILLSAGGLLRSDTLDERQAKGLARISSAAERANRMIRDLLDFTRARLGGGIPVQPRPLDFHALTQQTVEEIHLAWPEREIEVVQQGQGRGQWDGDRLAQVVTNLVNNALAYSPAGTPVRVETHGEEGFVVLTVHNQGAPISAELLPRLFEPMTRGADDGPSTSRSIGLGLYIVNQIVRAHGGSLAVHSTPSEGTTFTVRLPRG